MILNLVCPKCGSVVTKAEKEKFARNLGKELKCKSCGDSVVVAKANIRSGAVVVPLSKKEKKAQARRNKKLIECKDCGEKMSKTAKSCPHCGAKKTGSPIVKLGCGTIFAFFVFVAVIGSQESQPNSATNAKAAKIDPLITTAGEMFDMYQLNEIKADQIFKGSLLRVSGVVASVTSDFADRATVNLKTSNRFMSAVSQGDKAFTKASAELIKGQKITMTCIGGGEIAGRPVLRNCKIEEIK